MEKTGIFRGIDKLGRIVIPMEIRKTLDIKEGDNLEFALVGDTIQLSRTQLRCRLCDSERNLLDIDGKYVCEECAAKIKRLV